MTLPAGVTAVDHRQSNDTRSIFRRQSSAFKLETEFFNFTSIPVVKVMLPGQGLVSVPKTVPNLGTHPGLYVRYTVTVRQGGLPADSLANFPLLFNIVKNGTVLNPGNCYDVRTEYTHVIREIDLLSDEIIYEAVSNLYYGSAGADWKILGDVDCLGRNERTTASNFFQDITVVDDDRAAMYVAGFKTVKRIRTVSSRRSGLSAGVYVRTMDSETQQLVVKIYSDAESCRNELDIPIFSRYEEAENFVLSKSSKKSEPKNAASRAAKDRTASTETPPATAGWGDRFLGIIEGSLQVLANFLAWISGTGKPDEPPVKGKK